MVAQAELSRSTSLSFGPYRLIPARRSLLRNGSPVSIGARAFDLLTVLASQAGETVSKEELIAAVWPNSVVEENNLRVQLAAVRKALGERDGELQYITNVPLRGYCFVAPVAQERPTPRVADAASEPSGSPTTRHNLPARLTQLIGRASSVTSLVSALPARRLITLTGPGGVGKTSVALAAAEALLPGFKDGARFVDFAPLSDPDHAAGTLAGAIGVPVLSDNPLAALLAWLADKEMLLILDNCEHLIEAVALLTEKLLVEAPGVRIIATSREALRITGEWVQRLPALPVPPTGPARNLAELLEYPAALLFVERSRQSQGDLVFVDDDAQVVADLCRRLDGLPLAIELVAARIGMFGLSGLASRIQDRLGVSGQGRRTALPRHRTLRAALDWSYDMLPEQEQRMLRRLSIFRERFGLETAMSVAADEGSDALESLTNLVSKSLVSIDAREAITPYRLLETTRNYALERLRESAEFSAISQRHAEWFAESMAQAETALPVVDPAAWRSLHSRKIDDVRAALDWAFSAGGDPAIGHRLTACAAPLWFHMGLLSESLAAFKRSLDSRQQSVFLPDDVELRLCMAYAHCALVLAGPSAEVDEKLERAAQLAQRSTDLRLKMQGAWTAFIHDIICGNYRDSLEHSERFGELATRAEDAEAGYVYHRLMSLALHSMGEASRARFHVDKALDPAAGRSMRLLHGNPQQSDHRSASLTHRARILWVQGFADQALEAAEEACVEAVSADRIRPMIYVLSYAACAVALWTGDLDRADRYIEMLREGTARHAMPFWQIWPRVYGHASRLRRRAAGQAAALPELQDLNGGHEDMLATLGIARCTPSALSRAENGGSAWCAAEILRVAGERFRHGPETDLVRAEALFFRSLQLAKQQQTLGWALRSSISLASLRHEQERTAEAEAILAPTLECFTEGFDTEDALAARALLKRIEARAPWP